jgi:type IV pilus assembly protein PilY1
METIKHMTRSSALFASLLVATGVHAGITQLATLPLSGASSVEILPNILFVIDDSQSMDLTFLPDWAGLTKQLHKRNNRSFNGIAYNPAVSYTPPKYFDDDGAPDASTYPSQTRDVTSGWTVVKDDGYGVQSTDTHQLTGNAYYFTTVPGEYCSNQSLKKCTKAIAPSADYPFPSYLRWCKSAATAAAPDEPEAGACQATEIDPSPPPPAEPANIPFDVPRMPAPRASTLTITGSSLTSVSNITVDGKEILSKTIDASSDSGKLAIDIANSIKGCTFGVAGVDFCQTVGYSAVATGNTVVISAPVSPIRHRSLSKMMKACRSQSSPLRVHRTTPRRAKIC